MNHKKLTLNVLITLFTYQHSLALPSNFKRLVKFDDQRNMVKMVDLIGEAHLVFTDTVKRKSRKKFLHPDEKKMLTIAERTFLNTLREIAYDLTREPITLLWEFSNPRAQEYEKFYQHISPGTPLNTPTIGIHPFLITAGITLKDNLSTRPTNMLFRDTDTIRNHILLDTLFNEDTISEAPHYPVKKLMQPLYDLINNSHLYANRIINEINHVLNDPHSHVYNSEACQKLIDIWKTYLTTQLEPFLSTWITPYLNNNSQISLSELTRKLSTKIILKKLEAIFMDIDTSIMDFEVLSNIFISPNQHIMVYGGNIHNSNISTLLIEEFGFTLLADIGDVSNIDEHADRGIAIQLAPSAWRLLKLKPATAIVSYRQKGPIIKTVNRKYWKELDEIIYILSQLTSAQSFPILKRLENWIKRGFSNYINSPNTRFDGYKPLLMLAIEYNNLKMAQLLLRYGAVPNARWYDPVQDKEVSIMDIAQKIGDSDMINVLTQHGSQ